MAGKIERDAWHPGFLGAMEIEFINIILGCDRRKPTALGRWEEPFKFVAINPGSQCIFV